VSDTTFRHSRTAPQGLVGVPSMTRRVCPDTIDPDRHHRPRHSVQAWARPRADRTAVVAATIVVVVPPPPATAHGASMRRPRRRRAGCLCGTRRITGIPAGAALARWCPGALGSARCLPAPCGGSPRLPRSAPHALPRAAVLVAPAAPRGYCLGQRGVSYRRFCSIVLGLPRGRRRQWGRWWR